MLASEFYNPKLSQCYITNIIQQATIVGGVGVSAFIERQKERQMIEPKSGKKSVWLGQKRPNMVSKRIRQITPQLQKLRCSVIGG